MPFTFPNVTLYKEDVYRVCHSPEEFAALSPKGWAEESQAGVNYRPLSATWKPGPRPVVAPATFAPSMESESPTVAHMAKLLTPNVVIEAEQVKAQVTKK